MKRSISNYRLLLTCLYLFLFGGNLSGQSIKSVEVVCGEKDYIGAKKVLKTDSICASNVPLKETSEWYSEDEIIFGPGFIAGEGADFRAYISQHNADLSWKMEDRFIDANKNGIYDMPNSLAYTNPNQDNQGNARFYAQIKINYERPKIKDIDATFVGNVNTTVEEALLRKYKTVKWYVNEQLHSTNKEETLRLLGLNHSRHIVRAEIFYKNGEKELKHTTPNIAVTIKDILIITVGDSFASGEGNPDRTKNFGLLWADGLGNQSTIYKSKTGNDGEKIDNETVSCLAHRSTTCWSGQAALQLEKDDPYSSVTYVNVASGGAESRHVYKDGGIRQSRHRDDNCDLDKIYLPTQIDQILEIVGKKRIIDVLAVTLGGNDVGYYQVILSLILRKKGLGGLAPFLQAMNFNFIKDGAYTGNWGQLRGKMNEFRGVSAWLIDKFFTVTTYGLIKNLDQKFSSIDYWNTAGLDGMPAEFERLNRDFKKYLNVKKIYTTTYPNIGSDCYSVMDGDIDEEELLWAKRVVLNPMTKIIQEKSKKFGWKFIEGIEYRNNGHGACKPISDQKEYKGLHLSHNNSKPNLSNNYAWALSAEASKIKQGNELGSVHPNEYGHRNIAEQFLKVYREETLPSYEPIGRKVYEKNNLSHDYNIARTFTANKQNFLFLLKESNGKVIIYKLNTNGSLGPKVDEYDWTDDWTNAAFYTINGQTFLYLYKRKNGDTSINKINNDGSVGKEIYRDKRNKGVNSLEIFNIGNQYFQMVSRAKEGDIKNHRISNNGLLGLKIYSSDENFEGSKIESIKGDVFTQTNSNPSFFVQNFYQLSRRLPGTVKEKTVKEYIFSINKDGFLGSPTYKTVFSKNEIHKQYDLVEFYSIEEQTYRITYTKDSGRLQINLVKDQKIGRLIKDEPWLRDLSNIETFTIGAKTFLLSLNNDKGRIVIHELNQVL